VTWQMTRRSISSFPRVVVLLISYSQYTTRKICRRTSYALPLIVFSSLRPPSCSMLSLFDLSHLHFVVGHGICVENQLKTTVCDSITLTGKSRATRQTLVTGTGWARVTNSQPAPAPAGSRGFNPHGFTNP